MNTKTQNAFISLLRDSNHLVITIPQICEKYSYIESNKAKIKREIESLVDSGRVKRTKVTLSTNGRFMSSTIYQLMVDYIPEEIEMMESENYFQNISK
jgi:predicted transcriptional regulator